MTTQTNLNLELKNLSFTLYAYQIRSSDMAPEESNTDSNASGLWDRLIKLAQELNLPQLENLNEELICYEKGEFCPQEEIKNLPEDLSLLRSDARSKFIGIDVKDSNGIKATFDPRRLKDTYAADLTFYSEEKLTVDGLQKLNPGGCLLPGKIQASLGQTLFFFAEPVEQVNDYRELADACIAELLKGQNLPSVTQRGKLLEKPIFEYDTTDDKLGLSSHILVWFGDLETAEKAAEINWINLLLCRHKIVRAHQESRKSYYQCRKLYSKLEEKIKEFPSKVAQPQKRLKYLNNLLQFLPKDYLEYVRCLRDIKMYQNTLNTNSDNYKDWVKNGGSPEFLERFLKNSGKWQNQIKTDLNYLSPGQELFEQMVSTARGIAELDQAQSDRSLERSIQILGAGLGSGAIVASAIAGHIETPITLKPTHQFHPAVTVLFWSLIAGLFFGGIVWLGTGGWSYLKKKKEKN